MVMLDALIDSYSEERLLEPDRLKELVHPEGRELLPPGAPVRKRGKNKSWLFRSLLAGRERQMGLGSLKTIGLAEAREEAECCRKRLRQRNAQGRPH
jgi:hypothetical protein